MPFLFLYGAVGLVATLPLGVRARAHPADAAGGARRPRRRAPAERPQPLGPKRSVWMRSGSWPSRTRPPAACSTNPFGPQT